MRTGEQNGSRKPKVSTSDFADVLAQACGGVALGVQLISQRNRSSYNPRTARGGVFCLKTSRF